MKDLFGLHNRRQFLTRNSMGIGGLALAWILQREKLLATPKEIPRGQRRFDLKPKQPHFEPRAKAMISLFMHGGPSHMDLTDPKPELQRCNGMDYGGSVQYSFANEASRKLLGSPWEFKKHGQCGMDFSELLPQTAKIADELCMIRSMHTGHNGHEVSIRYINAGIPGITGRPSLGAWLTYGLGSENDELPAYMVLKDPGGSPVDGNHNWSNGWLPSLYQGTVLRAKEPRIFNLDAPDYLRGKPQENYLNFLGAINSSLINQHPQDEALESRIASFELAARMQTSAKEVLDVSDESEATKKLYGIDQDETKEYGTRCLIARRLVERGVRFVQLFLNGQPWDNHENIHNALPSICRRTDQPAAALVTDLKQRGLLESTVVHWGGEIGRLPVVQSRSKPGRDHNGQGFSTWMAGGGFKRGIVYGETDEVGHRAAVGKVTASDYQATLLHQFGLNHNELIYHHGGKSQKLTNDRPARVVKEILA
ncbi:MAG: DUF1501 domain-containing protein [Verrucomicrobiota bacterium]|nr:DUF1501 domain-containing protein [Verrucomicrobiota bacterium]